MICNRCKKEPAREGLAPTGKPYKVCDTCADKTYLRVSNSKPNLENYVWHSDLMDTEWGHQQEDRVQKKMDKEDNRCYECGRILKIAVAAFDLTSHHKTVVFSMKCKFCGTVNKTWADKEKAISIIIPKLKEAVEKEKNGKKDG